MLSGRKLSDSGKYNTIKVIKINLIANKHYELLLSLQIYITDNISMSLYTTLVTIRKVWLFKVKKGKGHLMCEQNRFIVWIILKFYLAEDWKRLWKYIMKVMWDILIGTDCDSALLSVSISH